MLHMAEEEIVGSYQRAEERKKNGQIKILAELNGCTLQEIRDVLEKNGITMPSKRKRKEGNDSEPPEMVDSEIPASVIALVVQRIRELEMELEKRKAAYESMDAERKEMVHFLEKYTEGGNR